MRKRAWSIAGILVGIAVLAAASYIAISLVSTGAAGLGTLTLPGASGAPTSQRHGYEVISPTEVPQTQPDVVGAVMGVQDKSFRVQPNSKGTAGSQDGPVVEVVMTADTRVYQDITKGGPGPIQLVDGKIQQRVAPYGYNLIKTGDTLIAWGDLRGGRLAAQAVIVEVSAATPAP